MSPSTINSNKKCSAAEGSFSATDHGRNILPSGPLQCKHCLGNIDVFPQTVLALRGSNGVGKGPLKGNSTPSRCRPAFFLVIYSTWWHLPSKTHSKIDILRELLHLVREWHRSYELAWLRTSWEPLGPKVPQIPPRCPPYAPTFDRNGGEWGRGEELWAHTLGKWSYEVQDAF